MISFLLLVQRLWSDVISLFTLAFVAFACGVKPKNHHQAQWQGETALLPCKSFIASVLTFESLIRREFIFELGPR